jgi:hypothetical protein
MSEPTSFRIDSYLPIPPRPGRRAMALWTPWPFAQMRIGDSFFVDATDSRSHGVAAASSMYKRINPGVNFETRWRQTDEIERKPGVRVWRTK